ncbi:PKD-like family lipoprotein [Solitalea koreensis]|uniref:PKD-like family protein n=1 Tax=Solitalea koreensis TaxID=543615 RepID=A0A521CA20_9SPHI|nr:PKD-like family lipoprotein [Solitalea koreensis]SMO56317.1 PKD-like family protein [Solitalea koreensis]
MKKIYSYLLAASIVVASSCKKDLGNYEYHDINKVKFSNISETGEITAVFGKPLTIKPEVSYTMDTKGDPSRYSYEWSYIAPVPGSKITVLATTQNLELAGLPLKVANDPYKFYYRITDKETGVQFDKEFKLRVRNEINEGWLLMTDVNGNAQLDMISLNLDNTTFTTINDLLAKTGSDLKLKGKPSLVYTYDMNTPFLPPGINLPYGFYVGTDQETNRLQPEDFSWSSNYNVEHEVFGYTFPQNFHYDVLKKCGLQHSYMIANGDLFNFDKTYGVRYSTPLNYLNGKIFKIAPMMAVEEAVGLYPVVVFDVENKRFLKHAGGTAATVSTFTDPAPATKRFSFTIGMDLVYMDFNTGVKQYFAILKDGSNKYWMAEFTSTGVQNYYDQMIGTDFDKAEKIAISPDTQYIFYNVGGKVYEYDMASKTTKLMLDMGAQKVSVLKFQAFHKTSKYKDSNKLIVCSYDPALPADKNGKMEMFTVPASHGDLVPYKNFSGFGKVVSLHYRER